MELRNTGKTPTERQNASGTPEHWGNNGTLTEQSEYHGIVEHVEHEKSSRIMEQQDNINTNTTNTERRHIEQIT